MVVVKDNNEEDEEVEEEEAGLEEVVEEEENEGARGADVDDGLAEEDIEDCSKSERAQGVERHSDCMTCELCTKALKSGP